MEIKEISFNNLNATLIKTNKFKTLSFQVVFLGEFSKETATKRSLLTKLLSTSTKTYNTKKALANKLMDMYDASFSISTYPSGETAVTAFNLTIVNEKNLGVSGLTQEALEFLREAIFNPNIENGVFEEKLFLEQKRILRERINNVYNNKNRYALRQMLKNMAPNEIISVSSMGDLEDLEKVTNQELVDLYQRMLSEENVSLYVVGDFEEEKLLQDLNLLGNFNSVPNQYPTVLTEAVQVEKVREFVEKQNIQQTKLMMGFRSNINTKSKLYPASLIFNAMYGGIFASDLIRVVREEHSLCYSIVSQFMNDVMILIVSAGIDRDKYQLTTDLVIKQLEFYKQGNINSDLMAIAKDSIINELIQIEDNPALLSGYALRNYMHGLKYSVAELIDSVRAVTPNDVQQVAQGINLDTIFLLTGEDYDG